MELLQDPDLKNTYDKCKYVVKCWEFQFKKKNCRLPSKLDIKEAPRDVRNAYKTYFNLKSAAIEESFVDVDGFNFEEESGKLETIQTELNDSNSENIAQNISETWGEHLSVKTVEEKKEKDEKKLNINDSFSKKLFNGSKFSKRNPRKSLSFSHKKSDANLPVFLSQPETSFISEPAEELNLQESNLFKSNIKIVNTQNEVQTVSTSLIQSCVKNKYKSLRSLDPGWIERTTSNSNLNSDTQISFSSQNARDSCFPEKNETATKVDYDSDDIIDNSDEEEAAPTFCHVAKKLKTDFFRNKIDETRLDFSNIFSQTSVKKTEESAKTSENKTLVVETTEERVEIIEKTKEGVETSEKLVPTRKSARNNKKIRNLPVVSDDEERDPFYSDGEGDADFEPEPEELPRQNNKKSKNQKATVKKRERNKNLNTVEDEVEEETKTYELEYSINPRIASVPRITNLKDQLKTKKARQTKTGANKTKTKREQEIEKFEKKVESGNLNENYVRIDLKKKLYVRGKKSINFSKYKKQQWKSKKKSLAGPDMDMGGCDGGTLTCFNCGETGHFARQCRAHKKDDRLLPIQAAEEEEKCPYPTLEEASQMAKESPLAIRKPLQNFAGENETETEIDEEDEILLEETLKMEKLVTEIDMKQYMDAKTTVKPYYNLKEDGSLIDTPTEVLDTLRKFGHEAFRLGQERAMMRILSGKSTLVTLSTGSGKSLCYQIPAYLYSSREPCITLVISPLVSLMEDQITGIPAFLKAACLHTNQTKTQREKIMEAIRSGNVNVLLVSPEAVAAGERSSGFGSLLRKLPPIAFACIDEAHCVSQWSHNFRPSYLMICRILRERLGVTTILGLTATATRSTSDSIINHLRIPDGYEGIISDVPLPDNLRLTVSKDLNKDRALLQLLLSQRFAELKSIIIYCTRREECERVAAFLRTSLKSEISAGGRKRKRLDVQAEPYHAGLSAGRRKSVQKAFMSGELRIVVATVAFGMGINKSDIRSVIHYNIPSNFESYVQEVGRAGRDLLPAHCHVFLDSQGRDGYELRKHIHANSMDRHVIRKLLQKIFIPCSCKTTCPRHEVAFSIQETVQALDITEETISTLLCYLELHDNRYIEVLSPAYTTCKIISYGGPELIKKAAKECAPLAMALVLHKKADGPDNVLEFPVVDVAAGIGWDSGICKHKLKNLEWIIVNNQSKRSLLNVQFANLGFRLLAPGNLTDSQLDEALDSIFSRVTEQEKTALLQLYALHEALISVVEPTYTNCIKEAISDKEKQLKSCVRHYFNSSNPLERLPEIKQRPVNEEQIQNDTRALVCMYKDNVFTGRAVARIFHGIQSPNYKAVVWGRCKFWRVHIADDFNSICRIATREILKMR